MNEPFDPPKGKGPTSQRILALQNAVKALTPGRAVGTFTRQSPRGTLRRAIPGSDETGRPARWS